MYVSAKKFILPVAMIGFFYLGFELLFNRFALIFADEFWFAHAAARFADLLPYRDFPPYKTVLGYYFLRMCLAFMSTDNFLQHYIYLRDVLIFTHLTVVMIGVYLLRQRYDHVPLILAVGLLLTSENTLLYSNNIRVDMVAYWFVFFSCIFILRSRFLLAGLMLGLGFTASQKIIWYIAAIHVAFGITWFFHRKALRVKKVLQLDTVCLLVIMSYLLFWSAFSSISTVINSVFLEAKFMYQLDWYESARKLFWSLTILHNPFLFLAWPLGFIPLILKYKDPTFLFLFVIIATIFGFLVPYKQIFPYYMQLLFPIFLLYYAALFNWMTRFLDTRSFEIPKGQRLILSIFSLSYLFSIAGLIAWLQLPFVDICIGLVPFVMLLCHLFRTKALGLFLLKCYLLFTIFFIGFLYPFLILIMNNEVLNGRYQKENLIMLKQLTADGSDYLAGTDFIYNRDQPIRGMQHLNGPAIDFLYQPTSKKLQSAMIPSLNFTKDMTVAKIITTLEKSNIKVYVNSYRMDALPKSLKNFLASHYQHYWGSLYTWSPTIGKDIKQYQIKFTGNYRLLTSPSAAVFIDNVPYRKNNIVTLKAGTVRIKTFEQFRLQYLPPINIKHAAKDEWKKMI